MQPAFPTKKRAPPVGVAIALASLSVSTAFADRVIDAGAGPAAASPIDPTGGAYTSPTLLFTPAASVPTWGVRVITSLDMQGPTPPDRLAVGISGGNAAFGFQPGIGGELGLPHGFTFGAGTNWVGGDPNPYPNVVGGLSPYFQLRYHILGDKTGAGFQLGTSLTYKFVGFGTNGAAQPSQDPGEMEWAVSAQIRKPVYELGLEGVVGKDFATRAADSEFHAYALYRPIPQLGLGAATQVRVALVQPPGGPNPFGDVIGGGIASLTLGRWQAGALVGESTVGLANGSSLVFGALAEIFGTVRLN